jgi:hypothetical protein
MLAGRESFDDAETSIARVLSSRSFSVCDFGCLGLESIGCPKTALLPDRQMLHIFRDRGDSCEVWIVVRYADFVSEPRKRLHRLKHIRSASQNSLREGDRTAALLGNVLSMAHLLHAATDRLTTRLQRQGRRPKSAASRCWAGPLADNSQVEVEGKIENLRCGRSSRHQHLHFHAGVAVDAGPQLVPAGRNASEIESTVLARPGHVSSMT